jgi:CRP/FNR family transcriptional regulator, cyclic AMP receptor protein
VGLKPDQAVSYLRKTRLFGDLDPDALARLADRAIERTYKKGQLIFYQGDPAEALFVVIEGQVKVVVVNEEGDEMLLVTLQPVDVFGEVALIDGEPRSASAETLEPTRVLVLTRGTFLEELRQSPAMTEPLLRSLGAVLRRLTEQAADLVFLDLHGRVAKLLVGLAEKNEAGEGDIELDMNLTQSDLASMVGGSRQSVNQILRSFERRGYLEMHGRKLLIKAPDLLRKRANL